MKPDPEIYLRTAAALDVRPEDCLFVGDGANDELARRRARRHDARAVPAVRGGLAAGRRYEAGRVTSVSSIEEVLAAVLITTTNDVPGYAIDEVYGEVFGLTVRSRNLGSQMGAGFKSLVGGELKGMTKALVDSRNDVIGRMVEEAEAKGANAVVAMRFDTSEMGGTWTEICAYGTAVRAHKL